MRPVFGQLGLLMTIGLSCLSFTPALSAHQQSYSPRSPTRVVSVSDSAVSNFVLLTIARQQQLPSPTVNFLPGPEGQTIMAADFYGVVLSEPGSSHRFANSQVYQVYVGQFQAIPPVVRVTLQAANRSQFKSVDFKSTPGRLLIKLPSSTSGKLRSSFQALGHDQTSTAQRGAGLHAEKLSAIKIATAPAKRFTTNDADTPKPAPDFHTIAPLAAPNANLNAPQLRGPIDIAMPSQPQQLKTFRTGDASYTRLPLSFSGPPVIAARAAQKPTDLQDSLSVPGSATRATMSSGSAMRQVEQMSGMREASKIAPSTSAAQPQLQNQSVRSVQSSCFDQQKSHSQSKLQPEQTKQAAQPFQQEKLPALAPPVGADLTKATAPSVLSQSNRQVINKTPLAQAASVEQLKASTLNRLEPSSRENSEKVANPRPGGLRERLKRLLGFGQTTPDMTDPSCVKDPELTQPTAKFAASNPARLPQSAPACRAAELQQMPQPAPEIAPSPTVQISLEGTDPLHIKISSLKHMELSTFRLHQPERLVIDISGLTEAEVPNAIPSLLQNPCLKSIRLGRPETGAGVVSRIVLDLASAEIATAEIIDVDHCHATITLQQGNGLTAAARQPQAPARLPAGFTVVLDAGHGGTDPGAQRGDVQEKELTLSIVELLKKQLQRRGVRIQLTRSDDTFVSLEDRVRITNAMQPQAFVSVHINAMETNTGTHGIETYFQNDRSRELAQLIHESLVRQTGAPDRSIRKARFYVINHTPVPAILAEVGFISNKDERDKLTSSDYQVHIASALADGVMMYLAQQASLRPAGTISALPPSSPQQTFTQNLHSGRPAESASKQTETDTRTGVRPTK